MMILRSSWTRLSKSYARPFFRPATTVLLVSSFQSWQPPQLQPQPQQSLLFSTSTSATEKKNESSVTNNNNNDDDDDIPQQFPIQRVGLFGDHFKDLCQSIPNSAVLSPGLQPGAYSWHIHILVVDSGNNEKHACALLPDFSS
mmetsp:Transcript_19143/g.18386  ORF Transcript_19143/g.18386 Transcript_19143/m.18386 type:complete len:143 (-) Transcript_19143:2-430(-)